MAGQSVQSGGSMNKVVRLQVPVKGLAGDANIRRQYAIQDASWIWHPKKMIDDTAFLVFKNVFRVQKETSAIIHVSADMRYELFLDGDLISLGPDRGDILHWHFASYELTLPAGEHELTSEVWWLRDSVVFSQNERLGDHTHAPFSQDTYRGGFILAAEGELAPQLNTGTGAWTVGVRAGWSFGTGLKDSFHVIGPAFTCRGSEYFKNIDFTAPSIVVRPVTVNEVGTSQPGWHLLPSGLLEQLCSFAAPGKIRAVDGTGGEEGFAAADQASPEIDAWRQCIDGRKAYEVGAQSSVSVLWDLEDYYCAYPFLTLSKGAGAEVKVEWAEALFEKNPDGGRSKSKGQRDAVAGKLFYGFGDTFLPEGGIHREYRSPWWRSGRFIRISIRTAAEPLVIENISIRETGYPLAYESRFFCTDTGLTDVIPLMTRVMRMCSHETYMDCPYYEQLMYVGDTRLEMLVTYMMTSDDRLPKKGIELFDWSAWKTGFIAEIWILMLRDFAYWRADPSFVRERMVRMRCLLEHFRSLLTGEDLIGPMPGWSFLDWVPEWHIGYAPDGQEGASSIYNLLFAYALQSAAELEDAYGETVLAARNRDLADRIGKAVRRKFWVAERNLFSDDIAGQHYSEHAQILALLTDLLPQGEAARCFQALVGEPDLSRTTVYFSFYLLETFYKFRRGDLLLERMDFWKKLKEQGFKTTVEMPEPSRSDCHAWGAHPLFHFHASLLGIRPAAPGFAEIAMAPMPGHLAELQGVLPHPNGSISSDLAFDQGKKSCRGQVVLPAGVSGIFTWNGKAYALKPGANRIDAD